MLSRLAAQLTTVLAMALATDASLAQERLPYQDPDAPLEERVADLLSRLTLEEKGAVLNHRGTTIERFGIRADQWNQCLHGVSWDGGPTTLFPIPTGLAATWNPELVQAVADAISDEARAIYNAWHDGPGFRGERKGLIYRSPVINILRNPYWGRSNEAWSEDPFLCGRMAVAFVRGLQGDDPRHLKVAATLKHYAVNNVETGRTSLSCTVPERMLREYWLPHFRDAVVEGKAQSLMASYNAVNGTPNNINHWLLTAVLKTEWGHDGFVVSDLGGVRTMVEGHTGKTMSYVDAVAQSIMAGCDFSDKEYEANVPAAVHEGKLTPERLDDAVTRVLRVRFRLGEFDPPERVSWRRIPMSVVCSPEHRALSLAASRQSIVLLQNRAELLPLERSRLRKLAVIGPLADRFVAGDPSYIGRASRRTVSLLQGIRDLAGAGVDVLDTPGCGLRNTVDVKTQVDREEGFSAGASIKLDAEAAGEFIEFGVDIPAPGAYGLVLHYKAFPSRGQFCLAIDGAPQGAPIDMYAQAADYGATADLGSKDFGAAGKRRFRFTAVGRDPAGTGFSGHFDKLTLRGPRDLDLELETLPVTTGGAADPEAIAAAADLAREADAAVVCVGTNLDIEREGRDRTSLALPGRQQQLVEAVLATNPRTVVVLVNAGPLIVPWIKEHVPAVLCAWWSGEEQGHALAEVLFGDTNPAGRLPYTVYAAEAQVPPQDEYDVAKGFTYLYLRGEPLYAFGHGLSTTSFRYGDLALSTTTATAADVLRATIEVENSGPRAGDEVVQIYARALASRVPRPVRELRGLRRVTLQPGEKRTLTFDLPVTKLAFYSEAEQRFVVEPGSYQIEAGASSVDIRARADLTVR